MMEIAEPTFARDGVPDSETLARIIQKNDVALLVETAKIIAPIMVDNGLTKTQFRAVFGALRQIHTRWSTGGKDRPSQPSRQLQLLKPRLAYQAARQDKEGMVMLKDVLTAAIDMAHGEWEYFKNLMDFTEALLAYVVEAEANKQRG